MVIMSGSQYPAGSSSAIVAPPPAYEEATASSSTRSSSSQCGGLSNAIWLSIFQSLIHPKLSKERQIQGRHELHSNVRHVCRDFYLASMHLLRSHHLAAYLRHVRPPYTSDPYPTNTDDWTSAPRRETEMLDFFIAASTRAEMESVESSLLMTNEGFDDLFTHHQPRARLEDLVVARGSRDRVIYPLSREKWEGVVAEDIRIDLRFKSAAIKLVTATPSQALRTIAEVPRAKEESLENTASNLVHSMSRLRISRTSGRSGRVYQVSY